MGFVDVMNKGASRKQCRSMKAGAVAAVVVAIVFSIVYVQFAGADMDAGLALVPGSGTTIGALLSTLLGVAGAIVALVVIATDAYRQPALLTIPFALLLAGAIASCLQAYSFVDAIQQNLVTFLIYIAAIVVVALSACLSSVRFKVALFGFAVIIVVSIVTFAAGTAPFAYTTEPYYSYTLERVISGWSYHFLSNLIRFVALCVVSLLAILSATGSEEAAGHARSAAASDSLSSNLQPMLSNGGFRDGESNASPATSPAFGSPASATDLGAWRFDKVKELKTLLDEGVLTQEEFDAKKKELLGL